MKIALISDTHWGIKGDDKNLLDTQSRFMSETFFPKIDELGIKEIIHLGDLFDRRKYVNYVTAKICRDNFIQPIIDRRIILHQLVGNHDDYYRNTNEYNSPKTLYSGESNIHVYEYPQRVSIGGIDVDLYPWICDQNIEVTNDLLSTVTSGFAFGHLELNGFDMHRGQPCEAGLDPKLFSRYDRVFSGHFHSKSSKGNITYLGSTGQYTWADYNDPRGFHVFCTETGQLDFYENPIRDFEKVTINSITDLEQLSKTRIASFMKMIVQGDIDRSLIDDAVDTMEKAGVHDLQIVHESFDKISEDKLNDDVDIRDTLTLLESVIDNSDCIDKNLAKKIIKELYSQSQEII